VFAAKRLEGELVVELSLITRFVQRREGADRALVSGIQPVKRLSSARGMRDGLDKLGAIRFIALNAARRQRPVDLLCRELMLA
jgi:hypothetical protein